MLYKYIIIYIYTCNMYRYHFSIYWGNLRDFTFTHGGFSRSFLFCNRNPDLFYCWLILGCTFPVNFHFPSQTVKSHSYAIFNHIKPHEMTVIRWMVAKSCTSWKRWFIPWFIGFQPSFCFFLKDFASIHSMMVKSHEYPMKSILVSLPRGHASLRGGGADRVGIAETFGQRQLQDGAWKENTMAKRGYEML